MKLVKVYWLKDLNWFMKTLLFCILLFCSPRVWSQHYNLNKPDKTIYLPQELREISDITFTQDKRIVCIQDEKGILFRLDIFKNRPLEQDSFYLEGDYEGIAMVKNDIYVLRSDGALLKVTGFSKGKIITTVYSTNITAKNNEGLCYDQKNKRLLIASKSRTGTNQDNRDQRYIYAYDLSSQKLSEEPVVEVNIPAVQKFAATKYNLADSIAGKMRIRPSAIAIHPIDERLYVLTATGFAICIYHGNMLEDVIILDPVLFNKAEGICFTPKGDMIISNEAGSNVKANMLYFSYIRNN